MTFSLRVFKATYNFSDVTVTDQSTGSKSLDCFEGSTFVLCMCPCVRWILQQDFSEESLNDKLVMSLGVSLQVWKVTNDPPTNSLWTFFVSLVFILIYGDCNRELPSGLKNKIAAHFWEFPSKAFR